jgi:hypothetical protein
MRNASRFRALPGVSLVLITALVVPGAAAPPPLPVSPGAAGAIVLTDARCPTFSWAGVPGALGYELAVFRVTDNSDEPALVTRIALPADARAWTPPVAQCLERGERYAWSVAADTASNGARSWSDPLLFEVQARERAGRTTAARRAGAVDRDHRRIPVGSDDGLSPGHSQRFQHYS